MLVTRILFLSGLLLFLVGTLAALRVFEGVTNAQPVMLTSIGLSVAALGLGAWRLHRRVDFDRLAVEQRLWESGPLGRLWLRIRKALFWSQ